MKKIQSDGMRVGGGARKHFFRGDQEGFVGEVIMGWTQVRRSQLREDQSEVHLEQRAQQMQRSFDRNKLRTVNEVGMR